MYIEYVRNMCGIGVWNMHGDVLGVCGVSLHVFHTHPPSPMWVLRAPYSSPRQKPYIFCAQASRIIVVAFKNTLQTVRFHKPTCVGIALIFNNVYKHLTK